MDRSTPAELENKIEIQKSRISTERMDMSFGEIISMYDAGELIINPAFQRNFRWTRTQRTALIESLLLGIPIPPIFVSADNEGRWEIVDGLQRVSTVLNFFGKLRNSDTSPAELSTAESLPPDPEDETADILESPENDMLHPLVLASGSLLPELEGYNIETLPQRLRLNLKRSVIRIEVLRSSENPEMKYELFRRLNSGGSMLTPQEIRNAVFRNPQDHVNRLVAALAQLNDFKKVTDLPHKKQNELYDRELVLRFIAFCEDPTGINCSIQAFLDGYMRKHAKGELPFDSTNYERTFKEVFSRLASLTEPRGIFRKDGRFLAAYFEGITVGLAKNLELYPHDDSGRKHLQETIDTLKQDKGYTKLWTSNSQTRIRERLKTAIELFGKRAGEPMTNAE